MEETFGLSLRLVSLVSTATNVHDEPFRPTISLNVQDASGSPSLLAFSLHSSIFNSLPVAVVSHLLLDTTTLLGIPSSHPRTVLYVHGVRVRGEGCSSDHQVLRFLVFIPRFRYASSPNMAHIRLLHYILPSPPSRYPPFFDILCGFLDFPWLTLTLLSVLSQTRAL